ncbi:MAG: metallophosphoesterase [Acholeplasmataceae bacterium]
MKKIWILIATIFLSISLVACKEENVTYTDDEPMTIASLDDEIKILQITDLHLTYGIDYSDQKTFSLIKALNASDDFDLIVISGDMFMSPSAASLMKMLIKNMESLETPWTFVFGNHDNDFNSYSKMLSEIEDTEYLYFKIGPEIEDGGYGNFKINFTYNNEIIYHAYFLDSKAECDDYTEEEGEYGYLSTGQVQWYENLVSQDLKDSVVYMHIPLRQMMNPVTYDGNFLEVKVFAQGVDTGFFDAMVLYDKSKAAFFGHDHLNDFTMTMNGIMLGYGRVTGYNAYGYLERGGRVVSIINENLTTYLVTESEVA